MGYNHWEGYLIEFSALLFLLPIRGTLCISFLYDGCISGVRKQLFLLIFRVHTDSIQRDDFDYRDEKQARICMPLDFGF